MKKRIFSMLIAICMVFGMMPVSTLAEDTVGVFEGTISVGGVEVPCTYKVLTEPAGDVPTVQIGDGTAEAIAKLTVGALIIPTVIVHNNVTYNVTAVGDNAFTDCGRLSGDIEIPSSVTSIGASAFSQCINSNGKLVINEGVKTIGASAFSSCTALIGALTIPASVTSIGARAFEGCAKLDGALTIPAGVTSIGDHAFSGCIGLVGALTIPAGVETIGERTFAGCSGLDGALTIPAGVTSIGMEAFAGCSGLDGALTIPAGVETINQGAFYDCSGLNGTLIIPAGVETIGSWAFVNCSGLSGAFTIPASVKTIGEYAFAGCKGLNNVTFETAIPPEIGEKIFVQDVDDDDDVTTALTAIYVPSGSLQTYKAVESLKLWEEIIFELADIFFIPPTPTPPEQVEVKLESSVDADGVLTADVKNQDIIDAIAKAKPTASGITIVINIKGDGTANSVKVNLPKVVQETVINKKISNTIVVVDNPNIKIDMDLPTITAINAQARADVNLTATRMDSVSLTGDAKVAIGTRPAFGLKANYGEGKQVEKFGAGTVFITIPYTMGENEKAENVCAVYVDENGNVQWLTDSFYDSTAKLLRFPTNHFSTYGVGYKAPAVEFTDTAGHWAKGDIDFVVSRGLFEGTSATTFSPDMEITRAMFVTVLGRLSGIDSTKYVNTKFVDVSAPAYYAPFVAWATEAYITKGTSDTTFDPEQIITRQEAAVFMDRYAKAMGHNVAKILDEVIFEDYASIASWASEAIKSMQPAGIIIGKSANRLDPTGTATRAEVSTILRRYIELIINTQAVER